MTSDGRVSLAEFSISDIFGNLARDSNFGKNSVDFLIPGEQIPVIDHRGVRTKASGSSYAVPRVVAMAVRYLSKNPNASVGDIKNILISRAVKNNKFPRVISLENLL